jgi:hypothetical protein
LQTALAETPHPILTLKRTKRIDGGAIQNRLPHRFIEQHHLIQADSAPIPGIPAGEAPLSPITGHTLCLLSAETDIFEGGDRDRDLCPTLRAEPPDQTLGDMMFVPIRFSRLSAEYSVVVLTAFRIDVSGAIIGWML